MTGTVRFKVTSVESIVCGFIETALHHFCLSLCVSATSYADVTYVAVLGCPDVGDVTGAVMHRTGNTMTVECLDQSHTWQLTCSGNRWQGTYAQCDTCKFTLSRSFRVAIHNACNYSMCDAVLGSR